MKKSIVILAVSLFLNQSAMAADDSPRSRYGIQAGMNFANASISSNPSTGNRTGFVGGVLLESPLALDFLFLQPELNFVQDGVDLGAFGTVTMNYLELPIEVKAKLSVGSIRAFALAGPSLAYLLSVNSSVAGTLDKNSSHDIRVGADIGGGLGFGLSESTDLSLSLKFSFGLTNASSKGGDWKGRGMKLLAGLTF